MLSWFYHHGMESWGRRCYTYPLVDPTLKKKKNYALHVLIFSTCGQWYVELDGFEFMVALSFLLRFVERTPQLSREEMNLSHSYYFFLIPFLMAIVSIIISYSKEHSLEEREFRASSGMTQRSSLIKRNLFVSFTFGTLTICHIILFWREKKKK